MREPNIDRPEAAPERKQQPTASQVLSKVYKQIVNDRRIHRAIVSHVKSFDNENDDDVWRMVILDQR